MKVPRGRLVADPAAARRLSVLAVRRLFHLERNPMLILSRARGESIDVNGPCRITVLGLTETRVKLGFNGPRSTQVARTELVEKLAASAAVTPKTATVTP